MPPPCFPPTVCDQVPPFPFTGSLGKVRPLHWYSEDTPTSAARLASSLRSRRDTRATPCPSLPPVKGALPEGLGLSCSAPPDRINGNAGDGRPPRFLGNPTRRFAWVLDPGGTDRPGHSACRRGPWWVNGKGSHKKTFEARCPGFPSRCLRFAGRVAPPRRKTRFRLLASSTGRDSHPQGSNGRFPSCIRYIPSPFPRLGLAQ